MSKTIQVVGTGSFVSATGSASISVGFPTVILNDLLFIMVHTSNVTVNTPSGWTEIGSQATQSIGSASAAGGVRLAVFWKWATGAQGAQTITTTGAGNANLTAGISMAFRHVNRVNPFISTANGSQASTSANVTCNGITTVIPNALILWAIAGGRDGNGTLFSNSTAAFNANLTNIVKQSDNSTNAQSGGGLANYTSYLLETGSTGNSTAVKSPAWTDSSAHLTIGLRSKARRFTLT